MMSKRMLWVGALSFLLIFVASATLWASANSRPNQTAKQPIQTKAEHKTGVKQADVANTWENTTGAVVKADASKNTLVLRSHGKDLKFSVPGRIDLYDFKPGDRVAATYVVEGKQLHLWKINKR